MQTCFGRCKTLDHFLRGNQPRWFGCEDREHKQQGLGRNEIAIGEVVGFVDRDQQQRTGLVIRLNDKTVSLQCGSGQWRVAYGFLHRVVDADALRHDVIEIDAVVLPKVE